MASNKGVLYVSGEAAHPLFPEKRLYMLECADKAGVEIVKTYKVPVDADDADPSVLEQVVDDLRKHNKKYPEKEQIRYLVITRYSDLEIFSSIDVLLDVLNEIGVILKAVY